ncbi:carbohydrate kinase family protein [Candidatus Woesebacteria bacterium]|nr:carbohydrate kinase family protein [Candidatus Woesebacteria bacterium]
MLDLLSIGTITIDLYYKGKSLTHTNERFELSMGGKYFADYFYEGLGGGGANVAIGVAKAGMKSGLMAKIGKNPFKPIICNKLDDMKISHANFCQIEDEYINISSILLNERGEKTIINYRTPHQHIVTCEDDYEVLEKTKAIYMANLSKVALTERIELLKRAKSLNLTTFANFNVTDCRRPVEQIDHFLQFVDVFIINSHECADICKTPYQTMDFQGNIVERFKPFRNDRVLIITDGKKGSYGYKNGKVLYQEAVPVADVVDTTGAGDGYTAGFIASYLQDGYIKKAMKAGATYATEILKKMGAN